MESKSWSGFNIQVQRSRKRELGERSLADAAERLIRVEHLADPRKESKICQARYLALMRSVPLPRAQGKGFESRSRLSSGLEIRSSGASCNGITRAVLG